MTMPGPTIAVIDDDDVVRDSLKALLESRNFAVTEFDSGRQFLHWVADATAQCLVLDVHMPDMNGPDLLKILRDRGNAIPVILITGRRDRETDERARELDVVAVLDKPVAHTVLFATIEKALGGAKR
ncbi:MAG: response regulator [Alphaproteobacteria bacterium]|nr:response regulator [Alphaproteobacteria bacterium]